MTAALSSQSILLLALLAPFVGALILPLAHKMPNLREAVTLVTAAALCLTVVSLLGPVLDGARPELTVVDVIPGLTVAFKVEPLGMLFALIASSLWFVNSVYSIGYMRANDEPRQTTFYVCFAVALGSTIGIAFAKNLFTLFLFYEALTLSTYPLVTHRRNEEAVRAGRTYLLLLLGTSLLLFLPAIVATWVLAGTLDFRPGGILPAGLSAPIIGALLALYVFGIGKAAVMPLHRWLPAAMVAPTPVSALLHAVAVVKAGVFSILKVAALVFGVDTLGAAGQSAWLTAVAGTTILVASIIALKQDNLKRRLAYSTISQLSYVVLGVAILAPISVAGAAMHIAAHAFSKITLFFAAGSIYTAAHLTEVSQLDGIGRRMPWTMGAFTIGALGMIGVPPTAGFLGKWFILTGAMQTANWLAVAVIFVSTILNAAYFLPIVYRAFFCEPMGGHDKSGEAPWPIVVALTATAIGTVLMFFFPDIPFALAKLLSGR
ncbi:monovalent cation/H+ antiporter subunit D family protein [Bradyrhizobium retamae]|uniref:Cation:proton antiporter n=1 Tax=Bradyrhizobium retamae TaxID=1300035 RepID=A0A0R3N9E5_9BRAD|nr:monovalent cation/H+ antiporter subunit D family protein [Bradyrhizobium retamae]KRR29032.1 cation:proton antiporter [Bradyrhizobium retamae]